jgi:hypothetical protein
MEEHKAVVPARKSKCSVPAMKSKVEAMAAGVPIYGGGGNSMVAAVVAGFGTVDLSLFDDKWCSTGAMNSTMEEAALPALLPTWVCFFVPSSPPPNRWDADSNHNSITSQFGRLSALGSCMVTHYYLKTFQIRYKFIVVRASFKLVTGTVAGFIPVIVEKKDIIFF